MTAINKPMGFMDRIHILKRAFVTAIKPDLVQYLTIYKTADGDFKTSHIAPKGPKGADILLGYMANAASEHVNTISSLSDKLRGLNIIIYRDWAKRTGSIERVYFPNKTVLTDSDLAGRSIIEVEKDEHTE